MIPRATSFLRFAIQICRIAHSARTRLFLIMLFVGATLVVTFAPAQNPSPASFYLHGSGATANPPTVFLDDFSPTASTEKYKDSAGVNFSGGNLWKEIGTWGAGAGLTNGNLTALGSLQVWVGLKNSDDQGTQFDLRAEVLKNGLPVAAGETLCVTGVTRNPNSATQVTISFGAFTSQAFNGTSDVLSLSVLTRIGTNPDGSKCSGPGGSHNNATGLRLYFDGVTRPSGLNATFSTGPGGTPPVITATINPPPNANGWNNTPVTVSFTCIAGSAPIASCTSQISVAAETAGQTVQGTVTDTVGQTAIVSITVKIDTTPPLITQAVSPSPNSSGWNNSEVSVAFNCADTLSGIASCSLPVSVFTSTAGQTVAGAAMDLAGNTASTSVIIKDDLAPPTISASASPASNPAGWNNAPVQVTFACADVMSGVANCPAPITVNNEGADQLVEATASDSAGNTASTSLTLQLDTIPPIINITSPPIGTVLTTPSVAVTGDIMETLSGVLTVSCNGIVAVVTANSFTCVVVGLTPRTNTISVQALDFAGNTGSVFFSAQFNEPPIVPPNAIAITPSEASMLVGETRNITLLGEIGQKVRGASWTIDDPLVVAVSSDDPPILTAIAQGTTQIRASYSGLSASMTVTTYAGTQLPFGTSFWKAMPLPGNAAAQALSAHTNSPSHGSFFLVENALDGSSVLRAFSKDGRQLWQASDGGVSQGGGSASAARVLNGDQSSKQAPINASRGLEIAREAQERLIQVSLEQETRRGRGPQARAALDKMRQLQSQWKVPAIAVRKGGKEQLTSGQAILQSQTVMGTVSESVVYSVVDNDDGVVHLISRYDSSTGIGTASLVRKDPDTGLTTWRYDSLGGLYLPALHPDGTIFLIEDTSTYFPTGGGFSSSNVNFHVLALDGRTGQPKFAVELPHSSTLSVNIDCVNAPTFNGDLPSQVGQIIVSTDGAAYVSAASSHAYAEWPVLSCISVSSFQTAFQLLKINPDGSSALFPIAGGAGSGVFDTRSGTSGDLIADNDGGVLLGWIFYGGVQDPTYQSKLSRLGAPSGNGEFSFPLQSWALGSMVMGEGSILFAADGDNVLAWDLSQQSPAWTRPDPGQGFRLVGSLVGNELAAVTSGSVLYRFASNGTVSNSYPLGNSSVKIVDPDLLLDPTTGLTVTQATGLELAFAGWPVFGGNQGWFSPVDPSKIGKLFAFGRDDESMAPVDTKDLVKILPRSRNSFPVQFSATAVNTNCTSIEFTWDFGDGSGSATGSSIPHTYSSKGEYTATATAKCAGATKSKTAAVQVTAFSLTVTEVSFNNDFDITEDKAGSAVLIQDPIWVDSDLDGTPDPNKTDMPVAYVRNQSANVTAKFRISPPLTRTVPNILIQGKGNGPEFQQLIPSVTGAHVLLANLASELALPNRIAYYDPLIIHWSSSVDPVTLVDSGASKHKLHVLLGQPTGDPATTLYRTVLLLATRHNYGITKQEAINGTWTHFSTGASPANVKGWDGRLFFYYNPQIGFSGCATIAADLLLSLTGDGNCNALALLYRDALAANGISSERITVENQSGEEFLVKQWTFLTQEYSGSYPYRAFFRAESVPGAVACSDAENLQGLGYVGMVPPCPNKIYGDLRSDDGLAGQNTQTPSEKKFIRHFIIHPILGVNSQNQTFYDDYRDPSYGVPYTSENDFQTKAVAAYCKINDNVPPAERTSTNLVCRKPGTTTEIKFTPPNP